MNQLVVGYCSSFSLLKKKKVCKKENSGTGKSRDEKTHKGSQSTKTRSYGLILEGNLLSRLGTAETDSFSLVSSMVKGNENCHEHQKKENSINNAVGSWMDGAFGYILKGG